MSFKEKEFHSVITSQKKTKQRICPEIAEKDEKFLSPAGIFRSHEFDCIPNTNVQMVQTSNAKPSSYDGRSPWNAYRIQFEMLAKMNGWSDQEKATILAINLRGRPALAVLSEESRYDVYPSLVSALDSRFGNYSTCVVHCICMIVIINVCALYFYV